MIYNKLDDINQLGTRRENLLDLTHSYVVHLWNETWRVAHLDKNAEFHPESLYEKLKDRYIV